MNHADGVDCGICLVRPWRISDLTALAHHLNNRNIWLNLRDRLPFPYTLADGRAWLEHASLENPITNFAVEIQGEIVGGIGLVLKDDVERGTAELGYWLAEPFWGRGLGTAAVKAFSNWTLTFFSLRRIFALPFAANIASRRVLEKSDFQLEGILRRHVIKDGIVQDQAIYAKLATDS